jgi:phosphoribosyl-ATP pyrophosphohydrolase
MSADSDILERLAEVLEQRRRADPATSYVAKLYQQGLDEILKKVVEETTEVVVAARSGEREQIVHEVADLWFHTLVLLKQQGLGHEAVLAELARRFGVSGIDEKAARRKS